jgi:hypothetical protein
LPSAYVRTGEACTAPPGVRISHLVAAAAAAAAVTAAAVTAAVTAVVKGEVSNMATKLRITSGPRKSHNKL